MIKLALMKKDTLHVEDLMSILDNLLLDLLGSLTDEQWHLPTIARKWSVKDIAAHLLDGNIRGLSQARDGHIAPARINIQTYDDLVVYLNQLNHEWVTAAKRMSPAVIITLLDQTGRAYTNYLKTLNPHADALFSVAWAGQTVSPNWFHIAREYTEKFLHQQQIRHAVGQEGLLNPTLYYPFLNTFMLGLPHCFRDVAAPMNTCVQITIGEDVPWHWYLQKNENSWILTAKPEMEPASKIHIPSDLAWKVFSKGVTPDDASKYVLITGNKSLGTQVLHLVAVMA